MKNPIVVAVDERLRVDIRKLDSTTVRTLRQAFTRSNPQYHKQVSMGFAAWKVPREIRSWELEDQFLCLPRGGFDVLEKILHEHGYRIGKIHDRSLLLPPVSFDLRLKPFAYQEEAIQAIVAQKGGIVRGGCGSGKTVILLGAIAAIRQPTLVIVHSELLANQWSGMVNKWLGFVPGMIGGGKTIVRPVTIGMQQTIWRQEKNHPSWRRAFGCVVADEIHHMGAPTFNAVGKMFPAAYKFGASASEKRKDGLEFLIYETFGPLVYEIQREELINERRTVPIHIVLVVTGYEDPIYEESVAYGELPEWTSLIQRMNDDRRRHEIIREEIIRVLDSNPKHQAIVLCARKRTCHEWLEELGGRYPSGLMIGGSKKNQQEADRSAVLMREKKIRLAFGTSVADEGLDIPSLTHVFVTFPSHNHPKRLEQMAGRAARACHGKQQGTMIYFWDEMMFPKHPPGETERKRRNGLRRFYQTIHEACSELYVTTPGSRRLIKIDLKKGEKRCREY